MDTNRLDRIRTTVLLLQMLQEDALCAVLGAIRVTDATINTPESR